MNPFPGGHVVRVVRIDLVPGCAVAEGMGIDRSGRKVRFQADWKASLPLAQALEAGEPVDVYLQDQNVIAWKRA